MPPTQPKLIFFYQNVRGLRTKLNVLRHNLFTFDTYEIIVLTETWLLSDILDSELGASNFQLFRLDRNQNTNTGSREGGVLIAVKSNFNATLIKTDVNCVEQIFILSTFKSVRVVIGTVYLPPQTSLLNYELHSTCVENLLSDINPKPFILYGDYNIPKTSWSHDDLGLKSSSFASAPATIISDSFAFLNLIQCNTILTNTANY